MQKVKLGDVGNVVTGSTPSTKVPEYYGDEYMRACPGDLYEGVYVSDTQKKLSKKGFELLKSKQIPKGSIMVCCIGSVGECSIATEKMVTNQQINSVIPYENIVYNKYLLYTIRYYKNLFQGRANSTVVSILNKTQFSNLEIPLPDLETQKAIADKLEKIENLIEQKKQVIQKTDELIKSTFIDMFGDPYLNPKGWESEKMINLTNKITDGEHNNPKFFDDGIPMIMGKNVRDDYIDFNEICYVSKEDSEKFLKKCCPEYKDLLLISRGATIGRVSKINIKEKFCLMGSVILIKPNLEKIISEYLLILLRDKNILNRLKNVSSASAQQAIYITHLKEFEIPIPPLELQQKFADIVSKIEQQKYQHQQSLEKLQELYNSTLQESFKF